MTEAEKKKVAAIVKMMGQYLETYPECKLSSMGLMKYAEVLINYPLEQLKAGMEKAIRKSEFFPKPVHIIEAIDDLTAYVSTEGKGIPTSGEAWHELIKQANRFGQFTDKWEFSTPEIDLASRRFGRMSICEMDSKEEPIARAQFVKIYESILKEKHERKLNNEALIGSNNVLSLANKLSRMKMIEEGVS